MVRVQQRSYNIYYIYVYEYKSHFIFDFVDARTLFLDSTPSSLCNLNRVLHQNELHDSNTVNTDSN